MPAGHIIVQMDFVENFTCQSLDEIQSAYWNATSITLNPVVAYHRDENRDLEHRNFVFVPNVNHHNVTAVLAILRKLTVAVKETFTDATMIHYWTDSPSSQYRNRYIFNLLLHHENLFGIEARWNFFESGYGKGSCDGIGGTCKHMASEAVRQGKATIQDGIDFFKWASQNEKSIRYIFYDQHKYDSAGVFLSTIPTKTVIGTMKLHAVCPVGADSLLTRGVSCYCDGCLTGNQFCNDWDRHTLRDRKSVV